MTDLRPLLRVADIARLTGDSQDTILRDIGAGLLHALRRPKGRAYLIRPEDFEAYLRSIEHVPAAKHGPRRIGSAKREHYRLIATGKTR